jgi:Cys-tRNA(Pro) deacylase
MTHALRALDALGVAYDTHEYRYVDHGGTAEAARQLRVDEHAVIKTLVFGESPRSPFLMLMHGDREVSAKKLARALGVKSVAPCEPAVAERVTGYQVGGISPFGTRQRLPVYAEASVLGLPRLYVNGGRRGLLVSMAPSALAAALATTTVHTT